MEENIHKSDRIDRYILGHMSESERISFEEELVIDSDLRHEYDIHLDIILATQRVHLREYLKKVEIENQIRRKIMVRRISTWSVAAAVLCFCVIGLDYKVSADLSDAALLSYAQTDKPSSRSDGELDDLIAISYSCLGDNDMEAALNAIGKAEKLIAENMQKPVLSEEDAYRHEIMRMQSDDLEWYKALVFMKSGKIIKSKQILKKIADSESRYAEKAKDILETIYLF